MSSLLRRLTRFSLISSITSLQHGRLSVSPQLQLVLPKTKPNTITITTTQSPFLKPKPPTTIPSSFISSRLASSSSSSKADEYLNKVLDSEIICAEEESDLDAQELPELSPFEVIDNPGQQTITLKREFEGERIQVEVQIPELDEEEEEEAEENDDAESGDDEESSHRPSISLIVAVSKNEGPHLEFCCTAYPDEITIDSMLLKKNQDFDDEVAYEGPEFSDLDDNLQKAFYKYLEVRGIKSSWTSSLHEYMIKKESREYLRWLKNVKEFVAM